MDFFNVSTCYKKNEVTLQTLHKDIIFIKQVGNIKMVFFQFII